MEVMKGNTWMDWEPRRDPVREDASFSNDELYRIRRENVILLTKLERIHRQSGQVAPVAAVQPLKHTPASFVNRKKHLKTVGDQNAMLLKRLENIKSTVGGHRARPGPPRKAPAASTSALHQPEWNS